MPNWTDAGHLQGLYVRKTAFIVEDTLLDGASALSVPVRKVAGLAVLTNPCVRTGSEDLLLLSDLAPRIGEHLMQEMTALMDGEVVGYGKAAIVGILGQLEHAAALLHPTLGKPIRAAVGGGAALIPSNAKVASAGASIDVPLAHRDSIWSFGEIDTMTLQVPDAPLPHEIVLAIVITSAGRPNARITGPVKTGSP
jgi:Amino acid synthesis